MRRDNDYDRLRHMLDYAEEVVRFSAGKTYDDLLTDRGLQHTCIRCLEVMGEAASHIDQDFRDSHPHIPWRVIIGMRNRLAHGYFEIDLSFVWNTVTMDVPALLPALRQLLDGR